MAIAWRNIVDNANNFNNNNNIIARYCSLYLLVLLLLPISERCCLCFILDSSDSSYAQFDKWNVALNGTLRFEFKTDQPNSLLLYTDDGGTYDFFEIKLVEGALRLRYNLGSGAQILTVGRELNDESWHKVTVERDGDKTSLTVDNSTQSKISRGKEFYFGNLATNSDVYIGGMPTWYSNKLTRLALPSVIFEPRFGGIIRNLVYADVGSYLPKRQRMKRTLRNHLSVSNHMTSVLDICEINDPCQNGGICVTTDNGAVCDCQNLDFEGLHCEKERAPSEASFAGKEYLLYDMSMQDKEAFVTTQDTVSFYFKTKKEDGLLFHSSVDEDYLNIAIKNGGISVLMKISTAKFIMFVKPKKITFNDNRWHKINLYRRIQELSAVTSFCRVTLIIDDSFTENGNTAGPFTVLSTNRIYVGGSEQTSSLLGSSVETNFVGCMKKVVYEIDNLKVDIIEFAKTRNKLIAIIGHITFLCRSSDVNDAITFTTPESFVMLPNWEAGQSGSFSLKFRTVEPHGLLVYSQAMKSAHSDLFAIELIDGRVYMLMDVGSGIVKEHVGSEKINDGMWHTVNVERNGKNGRVTVDGNGVDFITPGEPKQLDLGNGLFLGGLPWQRYDHRSFPISLWSATLKVGFVGCVSDLTLNKQLTDIMRYAQEQDTVSVEPLCRVGGNHCTPNPCYNYGRCKNGWGRFICDCRLTDFNGPSCSRAAPMVHFNGSQSMVVRMPTDVKYQIEDLIVRFKTSQEYGLLFATTHKSGDYLEIALFAGKIRMLINMGGTAKVIVNSYGLGDNAWHTIHYARFGDHIRFQVDNQDSTRSDGIYTEHSILNIGHVHIGGYSLVEESIPISISKTVFFTGAMQKIMYNGYNFIDAIKSLHLRNEDINTPIMQLSGTYHHGESRHSIHRPFTFLSRNTFIGLPPIKMYSSFNIYFQFKTKEPNGLILYNSGRRQGFFAVELVSGHIQAFIQTSSELLKIKDESRTPFNDNHWHAISIEQITMKICILYIDDIVVSASRYIGDPVQLYGLLYVGGVPSEKKPVLVKQRQIQSHHGYIGCLANIHLNSETPDLIQDALIPSTLVISGCEGSGKMCNRNVCENGGRCFDHWNAPTCDCSMTSYTGDFCSEYSIAYEFGPGRGLITYTYPENQKPETTEDSLALGFITIKDDAVLFRVDSSTSNDYIELEIMEGNIFVVYNMGTQDFSIGETSIKVNDNHYHVIRFSRTGANATLQLDDLNILQNNPTGQYLSVFNNQAMIQIGGKWNKMEQRIERPFGGMIAGLVFNGMRILDLTYERFDRTEGRGDISKREIVSKSSRQTVPTDNTRTRPSLSNVAEKSDDLIFSGAGSCDIDDEDRCKISVKINHDEIITPVYIPASRLQTTSPKYAVSANLVTSKTCFDDEDCDVGSGDSPVQEIVSSKLPFITETVTSGETTVKASEMSIGNNDSTIESTVTETILTTERETIVLGKFINEKIVKPIRTNLYKFANKTGTSRKSSTSNTTPLPSKPNTNFSSATTVTVPVTANVTSRLPAFVTEIVPEVKTHRRYPSQPHYYYTTTSPPDSNVASAGAAAVVIIVICIVLIIAICVIIVFLLWYRKIENSYKIKDRKTLSLQQEQKSVLLPATERTQVYEATVIGKGLNGKFKKRQDVKEWYV